MRRTLKHAACRSLDCVEWLINRYGSRYWLYLDQLFSTSRRVLHESEDWRYGPPRVKTVFWDTMDHISSHETVVGKVYCDLGCGRFHPLGQSAAMYVNGACATIAVDIASADSQRAAEALHDLLLDFLAYPAQWHRSSIDVEEFISRVRSFNLEALQQGRLIDGLQNIPIHYSVMSIYEPTIAPGTVDIISSRSVLEHFLDLPSALGHVYHLMSTNGLAYHNIDLVDHRAYQSPSKYHWWSFLAEDDNWSDGITNRLRSNEIHKAIELAGFEVLLYKERRAEMPERFRDELQGRFRNMSDDELSVIGVDCVLRKPELSRQLSDSSPTTVEL